MPLRNRLYVGIIDVPEFGVCDQRGDFEPLISEAIFYKAQDVLSGKVAMIASLQKRRPDFSPVVSPEVTPGELAA